MKGFLRKLRWAIIILLLGALALLYHLNIQLRQERNRYRENTDALLAEVNRYRVDSTRMALDVKTLRLTVNEFKDYRAEDAELIRNMGIRIKDLEAAAKHKLSVEVPIVAPVIDTVIMRDTILIAAKSVEMVDDYIDFKGVILDDVLTADVTVPVTLNQAVWVEYRRKFLWWRWRVKSVHQTITSDNPYVEIDYSEYIRIGK